MSKLLFPSKAQMARLTPHFPRAHGVPRSDGRRVPNGIIYVTHSS
jgi:transposase